MISSSFAITSIFILSTKEIASLYDVDVIKYNQYDDIFGDITGTVHIILLSPRNWANFNNISLYVSISSPAIS